ncbi:hypothetical protein Pyrfu_0658 [Pyrolobus fumarii 1A]|uniref:SHSP domain-containing protein n=1 Tax=Pyrolobus fumarii (strain DSM 11204 / 1A) TaxID=694429 RepID=G0EHF2_PYRF1|nr:Hsp20 family protein [Pyrolobus fumarii]AEM38527.1 hypothetical protein Pyrfu_0658 [Pyrolobus fumarii 1A]
MSLEELFKELERIRRILQAYGLMPVEEYEPPFDPREGILHPLYSLEPEEEYYRVLVDLPGADMDTLRVYTEGNDLVIEASLERAVEIETPWSLERRVVLRRYRRRIPLPPDADPSGLKLRVYPSRKIIEVLIPRR